LKRRPLRGHRDHARRGRSISNERPPHGAVLPVMSDYRHPRPLALEKMSSSAALTASAMRARLPYLPSDVRGAARVGVADVGRRESRAVRIVQESQMAAKTVTWACVDRTALQTFSMIRARTRPFSAAADCREGRNTAVLLWRDPAPSSNKRAASACIDERDTLVRDHHCGPCANNPRGHEQR